MQRPLKTPKAPVNSLNSLHDSIIIKNIYQISVILVINLLIKGYWSILLSVWGYLHIP